MAILAKIIYDRYMSSTRSIYDDIAAIVNPLPHFDEPADEAEHDAQGDYCDAVIAERERLAEQLEAAWDAADLDPLLQALEMAKARKKAADEEIRKLIAYGRAFIGPRPYRWEDLAEASGYSYSGTRSSYNEGTIKQVAAAIGAKPRNHHTEAS